MFSAHHSRLPGRIAIVVMACALALTACNSSSTKGSGAGGAVTGPEAPGKTQGQGTIADALIRAAADKQ